MTKYRDTRIEIFDSTLRDGAQGEGISFSVEDKLKIAESLDNLGIAYIEAGNPASNPKDLEFFKRAKKLSLKNAKLCAFGSTKRKLIPVEQDENVNALLSAETDVIAVFGKSWKFQVDCLLNTTPEENLNMIRETIAYLVSKGKTVFFDGEHFFDGYKDDAKYAMETIKTAEKAGASAIILCDTKGGNFPEEIGAITKAAAKEIFVTLGIHCHDDCGCGVANSLFAVRAGAKQVQGTFLGVGERCGNANLSTLIADLQLKYGYKTIPDKNMHLLTETARYIAEVINIKLINSMPYVGSGAFAHKAGMHADGVGKNPDTYEHIAPEIIGNQREFLLSEISGRSTVLSKLHAIDSTLAKDSKETIAILEKLKQLESCGFQFEAANASFELLVLKTLNKFQPFFEIDHYEIISSQKSGREPELANAIIKVKVGNKYGITADEGYGPVNAIDKALRKALEEFYPVLCKMHLADYKVRVLNSSAFTGAVTRVLIESTDGERSWTTVGASTDIIGASMTALIDSIDYMLYKKYV